MKMTKRILSAVLILCMVLGMIPGSVWASQTPSGAFRDVKQSDWFYESVEYVRTHGMMNGDGNGRFMPRKTMTRGMVVTVLHRLDGCPAATGMHFDDVSPDEYYADAISWASASGIVKGYGNGKFGPEDPVTREQMAAICYRYSAYRGYTTDADGDLSAYRDKGKIQSYAVDAMRWAVGRGILTGFPDGTLQPAGASTRAQISAILMRFNEGITIPEQDKKALTRGEWIDLLVKTAGYPHRSQGGEASYADIAESPYREVIETAVINRILVPAPGEAFRPDETATREFGAETAANALGYAAADPIKCKDASEIANPQAAKAVVDHGLMDLEDGYFHPQRPLQQQEADRILAGLEKELGTAAPDGQEHEGFVYLDGVIQAGKELWPELNGEVTVPEGVDLPTVGDILVFGTKKAMKVTGVTENRTFTYVTPELYEFLDYMDVQGEAQMDFSNFIPAENVTVNTERPQAQTFGFMDDWFDVPSTDVHLNNVGSLDATLHLTDSVDVVVNLDLAITQVAYGFDIDFDFGLFNDEPLANVKNAYVKISEDSTLHIEVVGGGDKPVIDDLFYPPYIELGTIPIIGADGIGIVVEVDLVLTAEGKFVVEYREYGTLGVQVKNNRPRNITAIQADTSVGVAGAIKLGPQIRLLAEVFEKDLLSFSADAGVQVGGSATVRSSGMVCLDAGVTLYAEIKAFENCLLDNWLDIALKFTIWDENNSPLHLKGHWENLELVDKCTYRGDGIINGSAEDADDHTKAIPNASIEVISKEDNKVVASGVSDADGRYSIGNILEQDYIVRVSADGYLPYESEETVRAGEATFVEAFLMVEGEENSGITGTIGGHIINAVNGLPIPGVSITVYKGRNVTSGTAVTTAATDADGNYTLTMPIGNYTLALACEGYVANHINAAVTQRGNSHCDGNMNPDGNSSIDLGNMRIVLTWGENPSDLDSHLRGPGAGYHIWYRDKGYNDGAGNRADLDLDDTSSYGPETTTVYDMQPGGVYSFYVHNYSQYSYGGIDLSDSGAKVQVYMGEEMIATYHVPAGGQGTVWHVFDFDSDTGTIRGINTFSSSSPESVGA